MKKLHYGVGTMDANYKVKPTINGKVVLCPFYQKWKDMLKRAYYEEYQNEHPAYIGTTVCKKWHSFMCFRSWMIKQNWEGLEIDKDIIKPGNKEYSPRNCCFVPRDLNMVFRNMPKRDLPTGLVANVNNTYTTYTASFRRKYLGTYKTPEEAHKVYLNAKIVWLREYQYKLDDKRIVKGIERNIDIFSKIYT